MTTQTMARPRATTGQALTERPLPLSGVRVLDLGQVFQGPYAGFLMAMAGAEVIKIEPPHGDMSRRRARDGDYPSGAHLYGAITTALFERERTGQGRAIEVSMLESMFAPLLPSAGHAYTSNAVPERSGNRHVADSYVPFDTFETKDGWIAVVCGTD